jgi:hypothetical protein
VKPVCKLIWRFLKKLKIEVPNDPAIPFLGNISEGMEVNIVEISAHPCLK